MSIYTKGGDKGETSLLGGIRVAKDDLRIEVYGTLDEVTSALGLARATTRQQDLYDEIVRLQAEFIDIMGELASGPYDETKPVTLPGQRAFRVGPEHVQAMERLIDKWQAERIPYHGFVKPGGSQAAAAMDMARTFTRRAERRLVSLGRSEPVNPHLMRYFNRLSDLLYMMARIDEQREIVCMVEEGLRGAAAPQSASGAVAAKPAPKTFGLDACEALFAAGQERAKVLGVPMVMAVVDGAGELIAFKRMDGALPISSQLAPHKAYTAAAVKMATHELGWQAQPGAPLAGIDANIPKLTTIGGGLPLKCDGVVIGAVGVSGGSVEQDISVALAMAGAL